QIRLINLHLSHQTWQRDDCGFTDTDGRDIRRLDQSDLDLLIIASCVEESVQNHRCEPTGRPSTDNNNLLDRLVHCPPLHLTQLDPIVRADQPPSSALKSGRKLSPYRRQRPTELW